jgi:propanol-preferring alcohol dehydrogenase
MASNGTGKNRAILYSEPGTIKTHIEELPIEKPGPGQVLVKM